MRILFIHNRYRESYGGEDAAVDAEVKLMKAKGHEVELLLFDNADMGEGLWSKMGTALRSAYNVHAARKTRETIAAFTPDIVHVHNFFFMASPSVIITAHRHKIPVVLTLHNYRLVCVNSLLLRDNGICELCVQKVFPWPGVKYKCYHDSAVESAMVGYMSAMHKLAGTWRHKVDMFITPAAFGRTRLINSSLKLAPGKITVKRNFIEDPGVSSAEKRLGFYLFVGRLSTEKGIDFLARCFSEWPGEELVIVGDGPEREALQSAWGHLPNIRFAGKKDKTEVIALLKSCRALLFPSVWYEGAPVTIVEAFATGTPVIASRLGAMEEMIDHNYNGLLFDTGSREALKEAIDAFRTRYEKQDYSLYAGARERYQLAYHPDKCYESVMEIYTGAINAKKQA